MFSGFSSSLSHLLPVAEVAQTSVHESGLSGGGARMNYSDVRWEAGSSFSKVLLWPMVHRQLPPLSLSVFEDFLQDALQGWEERGADQAGSRICARTCGPSWPIACGNLDRHGLPRV